MKTKTCKYCFSIIPKNNRTCPVCNKKQDEFPRETNRAQDPEAMIARDPLWREKTAQYPDTLSLMRAYLADPSANPEIKRWVNLMLPKE